MELSWAAALIIPTVVTPAVLLYFFFRLLIPKAKAPPQNDFVSVLLFSLLAILINVELFGYTLDLMIRGHFGLEIVTAEKDLFQLFRKLIGRNAYDPIRPFVSIYSNLVNPFLKSNIFGIFIDLHLRPVLIGASLYLFKYLLSGMKYIIDYNFYNQWQSKWLNKAINFFSDPLKKYFFSYWNYILDFNQNIEILMMDISTTDESLYSGMFIDWTPDDSESTDTIGSIGIKNVFKYETPKDLGQKNIESQKPGYFSMPSSSRRWRLIKNDGELYIPYSQIKSIHIWKIIKGTNLNIWVNDTNTNERLKWYLLLVSKRPDFFHSVKIRVSVKSDEEGKNYEEVFVNWLSENSLESIIHLIDLVILVENK